MNLPLARRTLIRGFMLVAGLLSAALAAEPKVRVHTEAGTFDVALDATHAPKTVANFLKYVDAGRYSGGQFHRTVTLHPDNQPNSKVKIEVIQGGVDPEKAKDDWPPLALERTNATGLRHRNGTISMARDGPDTATSDFFICIGDQPELDFAGKRNADGQGFAAFGQVVAGFEVVKKIHESPVKEQKLSPPIRILKIERVP